MAARLGRAARQRREHTGLHLIDIATEAGVGQTTVHRFEAGTRWVQRTDDLDDAYARLCDTTPEDIWRTAIDLDDPAA